MSSNISTIELNSQRNITVYQDLAYRDRSIDIDKVKVVVGESAKLLNVYPTWHNVKCYIRKGNGSYPSNILEWSTVKSLIHRGVIRLYDNELNEKIKAEYAKAANAATADEANDKHTVKTVPPTTVTPEVTTVKRPGRPPKLSEVVKE